MGDELVRHPRQVHSPQFDSSDILSPTERYKPFSRELRDRLFALTEGIMVDLDAPIDGPVDL